MNFDIVIAFIFTTSVLAISPGPDNIYVLLQSAVYGKKYGLATVAGLMSGCIVHTALVAVGVSAVIKQSDTLFFLIKLLGAAYLFFLAYKVWRSAATIELTGYIVEKKSPLRLYKQGFIMNVLNPKVSIFFLAFFPGFLFSNTWSEVVQFYILGALFIVVSGIVFGGIAVLAGWISKYLKKYTRIGVFFKWLQILVFIGIGVFIFFS